MNTTTLIMKKISNKLVLLVLLMGCRHSFADNQFAVKGDFRFRTENIKEQQAAPLSDSERTRQRIRLRIGATTQINSKTEVGLRFATGTTSAAESTTTNQDLTDYESHKSIILDLAYFNHKATDNLSILGGKTVNPYYFVGANDLIFDNDITPEGLALKYKQPVGSGDLLFNLAGSWLSERFSASGASDNTDVGLLGAQLGYVCKNESYNAAITLASYNFANIKGAVAPIARGNSLTGGLYDNNYKLTSVGFSLGTQLDEKPITAYVENVANSEVSQNRNATIYGLKYGQLKDPESWSVAADFREIEKDAVLGAFTDSDVAGGGTDVRSWRASIAYQLDENMGTTLTYFNGKRTISSPTFSPDHQRIWLDFNFNF